MKKKEEKVNNILYICLNFLQEVGRLQKVFEKTFFLINPDGVLPVGVFYFITYGIKIKFRT